jgi:serine/threonine-protein kinase
MIGLQAAMSRGLAGVLRFGHHGRMPQSLRSARAIEQPPREYLAGMGEVFAFFGPDTQDSGNLSFGVRVGGSRYFVKTTDPEARVYLDFPARVALLRNAAELNGRCTHPALPQLLNVVESPAGPMLVYEWVAGELLRAHGKAPDSAPQRFRALPVTEILQALDRLYSLHEVLARAGYVAVDFYDGCLIYDFVSRDLHVVDLDGYHPGPFENRMGRMFGSSRFMAPEEFELGALIDQRTTVFNLARAAAVFLADGSLDPEQFQAGRALHQVILQACQRRPSERFESVESFHAAWLAAR